MKKLALFLSALLFTTQAFAVPSNTMSISPSATSGDTIRASDENSRNNSISSTYNSHSHNDIANMTGVNVFTIGDSLAGSKAYAVATTLASNPAIRWDSTLQYWTLSSDGTTYSTVAHLNSTNGLTSGAVVYSGGTGILLGNAALTNGQLLIGSTNNNPVNATLTAGTGITVTNGAGTITVASSVAVSVKVGNFTRDTSAVTGTVAYTGVGFTPKALIMFSSVPSVTGLVSWGFTTGSGAHGIVFEQPTAGQFTSRTDSIVWLETTAGTTRQDANLSTFDADGFTLSWTKTGSPTGTATCTYIAIG